MLGPLDTRSRYVARPRGRRLALTERDLKLFRLLDRYRYLPANFLHAFLGGHPTYHRQRLTDLFHEGWLRKPDQQWDTLNARYRPNCYELGAKALKALDEAGQGPSRLRIGSGAPFWHELLVCLVMASFELAAPKENIELLDWRDALRLAPSRWRDHGTPFAFALALPEDRTAVLRPDALPFALKATRTIWFPGIELDRHTEPLHPTDLRSRRSSILLKFLQYQQFVRDRVFEQRLGLPNILVPFITVNETHMRHMIELAMELSDGRGLKWMLFKALPHLASREHLAEPQWDLLRAPWLRPGHPPVRLLEEVCK